MYRFLSSILQIMDVVELALQPASEGFSPDACTPTEKAEEEKSRVNNLARTLDDNTGHKVSVHFDKPQASNTKTDDNKAAEHLGYSCWMITSVWDTGQQRLLTAFVL